MFNSLWNDAWLLDVRVSQLTATILPPYFSF